MSRRHSPVVGLVVCSRVVAGRLFHPEYLAHLGAVNQTSAWPSQSKSTMRRTKTSASKAHWPTGMGTVASPRLLRRRCPSGIELYCHRIGRVGRSGVQGLALAPPSLAPRSLLGRCRCESVSGHGCSCLVAHRAFSLSREVSRCNVPRRRRRPVATDGEKRRGPRSSASLRPWLALRVRAGAHLALRPRAEAERRRQWGVGWGALRRNSLEAASHI